MLSNPWFLTALVLLAAGLVLRSILRARAERRRREAWEREFRRRREQEEREERERRERAAQLARPCLTEDDLAHAAAEGREKMVIEGSLANRLRNSSELPPEVAEDYEVALARHGKLVLQRRDAAQETGAAPA